MAETNLDRLDRMFPNILLLDAVQTAEALGWTKARIYKLAAQLPFVRRAGDTINISKLALAEWLDGVERPDNTLAAAMPLSGGLEPPVKRGVGRPRNSAMKQFFVESLLGAYERHAFSEAIFACQVVKPCQDDVKSNQALADLLALPDELSSLRESLILETTGRGRSVKSKSL